jgi:Na+/melibiose symporter-like transporter
MTTSADNPDQPIPLGILAAYGSLALPLAAGFIALQVIVPTFYAQALGLSLSAVGGILLVARLWDMVTDPVVGFLSDRTPTRFGRRKVWVVASAPLIAISVWMMFNPGEQVSNSYLLLGAMAIYIAGTMALVPINAWGAELSSNYHQRSRVAGSRVVFGLGGTMLALLLIDNSSNAALQSSLTAISILVLVALVVTVPTAMRWVPDNSIASPDGNNLRGAWRLLVTPSPFRRLLVAFLLNGVANAIPAPLFLLFVTHVLEQPALAGPVLFLYFVCSAISVPVWVHVARRFGKHHTWCGAVTVACVFFAGAPFLSAGDTAWYIAIVVGTGLMIGADLALPSAINGDLIELDAHENGQRRPGLFFALWGTASKLAFALAVGLVFPLLDLIGFDATASNSAEDIRALAILYGGPSILFKLVAVAMMRHFPIDEAEHRRIRNALAAAGQPA